MSFCCLLTFLQSSTSSPETEVPSCAAPLKIKSSSVLSFMHLNVFDDQVFGVQILEFSIRLG